MVALEIFVMAVGIVYGYLKPGKENRIVLFKKGVYIGIILGIILTMLGLIVNIKFLLLSSIVGFVIFIEVVLIAIFFVIGTFIGDWIEEKTK